MDQSLADRMPRVAIVTPVYNGAKYLRQTMESVQQQTYPNLVHVVCNNCSTDESADIIREFADARVPVLAFENEKLLPLAANWNKAFSHLPEDIVYAKLLCADDLIRADGIEQFVAAAESDRTVEVVLSQDVFDDRVHHASLPRDRMLLDGHDFARKILLGRIGWVAFHHFFVRVHPDYRQGRFIDDYWSPDPHVVMRSALRGTVAYLQAPLVYNRIHADSVTGKELGRKGVNFELVQMHLIDHFGRAALGDGSLYRRSVRTFLTHCCRLAIRWRLTRQAERSAELLGALRCNGYRPGGRDYLRAILSWPWHSLVWRYRQEPLGATIDERTFSGYGIAKG